MASSLLRLRSSARPTVSKALSACRLPNIHSRRQHSVNMSQTRPFSSSSSSTVPKFTFDLSFLRGQMETEVPSMLFTLVKDEEITLTMPGLKTTETEEAVCISFDVPKLGRRELRMDFAAFNFLIQLKTPEKMYLATIRLPENFDPFGDLKGEFKDGVCCIRLPTLKHPNPIITKANINRDISRPTPYCDNFNQSELGQGLCEIIAHPEVKSKSFTAYRKDDGESIYFKGNMPGVEKLVVTKEGLCVSLSMPGFKIEEVLVGFEYGTLIIEGKRESEHYIAGVWVPEGFHKENHMIKREMQDGVFKATLPHVDGNRAVFSVYH